MTSFNARSALVATVALLVLAAGGVSAATRTVGATFQNTDLLFTGEHPSAQLLMQADADLRKACDGLGGTLIGNVTFSILGNRTVEFTQECEV